jgi:hypothetical protein
VGPPPDGDTDGSGEQRNSRMGVSCIHASWGAPYPMRPSAGAEVGGAGVFQVWGPEGMHGGS